MRIEEFTRMTIESERVGDVVVLKPAQRLDVTTGPVLRGVVEKLFEQERQRVLIDLESVEYVSSIGLSACLRGAQLARARRGLLVLSGMKAAVRRVFAIAGLDELLHIQPTRARGLASLLELEPGPGRELGDPSTRYTLPEEILLLAIRDEGGQFVDLPEFALDFALAGAVLIELCKLERVDSDLERLTVVDAAPLGDDILDPVLAAIAAAEAARPAEDWIKDLAQEGAEIRGRVIDRLVQRRVLVRKDSLLHWALGGRRYPLIDDREQREVKQRVLGILRSNELPGPQDVVIIAVADACAVFDAILSMDEMLEVRARIAEVARLDLLAQAMTRALRDVQTWGGWNSPPRNIFKGTSRVAT